MINKQIIRESLIELAEINSLEVGLYGEKGSLFISSKGHKQLDSEKIASLAEKCTSGQLLAKGGKLVCKIAHIEEPIAKGLAFGASSHAIGTARAIEIGDVEGAMSGLAIAVSGIFTVLLSSVFASLH